MRLHSTHTLPSLTLCLAACSGGTGHVDETGETTAASSETTSADTEDDATSIASSTGVVDTSGVDPTIDASSSSGSTVGTSSDATSSDATSSEGTSSEGGASSDDATSTEDSTTGEVLPDGDWCGYVGTGGHVLEDTLSLDPNPVAVHAGAPIALAVWDYNDGGIGLRAAVYDIPSATWQDTVTLEVGSEVDLVLESGGAVDAEGDAMIVAGDNLGEPAVRAHRYDAATATWTTTTLPPAMLTALDRVRVTVDADGDAVVVAEDFIDDWVFSFVHWFYDAATDTWSEPYTIGPIEDYSTAMQWAQDPTTGDAAFAVMLNDDVVELRHRSAATGEWTTEIVEDAPEPYFWPIGVSAIGDGEFVAIADSGDFGADNGTVTGFVYSDGAWVRFTLDANIEPSSVRIVGATDGRALVSWNAWPTSIRTRVYDRDTGWSPLRVVNEGMEGENYVSGHRTAFDDGGFVVGWTQYEDGVRTYARRYDEIDGWSTTTELDPEQPDLSAVSAVHAIGPDTTRIVWARDQGNANFTGWYYACHTPGAEWTAPVLTGIGYPRFQPHAGGEFLVSGIVGQEIVAEYFAAP